MELQVDIDEADVGQVNVGQAATFTVDAWPNRSYPATIMRVGFGATQTEGVVSYPATLTVDNNDLSLRPGMTASAEIITLVHDNVLLVPNAALRYSPPQPAAQTTKEKKGSVMGSLLPRRPHTNRSQQKITQNADGSRQLWILKNNEPVPVIVHTGASNGAYTEILSGDLSEGSEVITESIRPSK